MPAKSTNDYSALGSVFRDGVLGVLLSTGLLSTLVPNSIESLGKVTSLNSFSALNLFSVIYFIFPVIIFTTYWLVRGSRLFLFEKFSNLERTTFKKDKAKKISRYEWIKSALLFSKISPLVLFVVNVNFYSGLEEGLYFLGFYYTGITIGQLILTNTINRIGLTEISYDTARREKLLYRSFCIDAMIFFLDVILGLTLVVFSKPWIVYSEWLFFWSGLSIALYAMGCWVYSVFCFKDSYQNIQDFAAVVLLTSAGLCVPSINRECYDTLCIIVIILLVVISFIWFLRIITGKTEKKREKTKPNELIVIIVPAIVIVLSAGFLVLVINKGLTESNLALLKTRFESSRQIPVDQYFPLDSLLIQSKDDKLDQAYKRHRFNEGLNPIWINNGGVETLRKKFYWEYEFDSIARLEDMRNYFLGKQSRINWFSQRLYKKLGESFKIQHTRHFLDSLKSYNHPKADILLHYLHPVDYMALRLNFEKNAKDKADSMIRVAESLYRVTLLKSNSSLTADYLVEKLQAQTDALFKTQKRLYKMSPELRADTILLQNLKSKLELKIGYKDDSAAHLRLIRFHKLFFESREVEYIKTYEATQVVYRSYLLDSQRMGIWTFLVTVLVLALAVYFNYNSNEAFGPTKDCKKEDACLSLDTPRNTLFMFLLAVLILLIPLMKPIEPENIDPEKPYWMVSLQNWYTPTFIKALTDQQDEHHYEPGENSTIDLDFWVATSATATINFNQDSLLRESLDKIARKLEMIRKQIASDEHQLKPVKK